MIQDFVKLIPGTLMNRSGSVFYSGRQAFGAPSELYVLGINPGGNAQEKHRETLRIHTDKVLYREPESWSAYRDESWEGRAPGTWGMQPRVLHLFARLGINPGAVPSSNVVFVRSARKASLEGDYSELATECWPFHQAVIEELGVRVIVCLGQDAGNWARGRMGATRCVDEFREKNCREWTSRTYANVDGLNVVVATHPSRADWTCPATDPTALVERALDRSRRFSDQ